MVSDAQGETHGRRRGDRNRDAARDAGPRRRRMGPLRGARGGRWRAARRSVLDPPLPERAGAQRVGRAGGQAVRQRLGLDERPVVLLATNVFGDSVTLGRQVFSQGMGDWLAETLRFFAAHPQVQLVVRVHPGESMLAPGGTSMLDIVKRTLPDLPSHIKVVPPEADVNSYDVMEMASLGLVYTTTLGLEMAMDGIPVVVAGQVHYRGRGFTLDPTTWEAYFGLLERAVQEPQALRLSPEQVERAQRYAYHFFFTYPRPYPWHLLFWEEDLARWPLDQVLANPRFVETLDCFAGEPLRWTQWA